MCFVENIKSYLYFWTFPQSLPLGGKDYPAIETDYASDISERCTSRDLAASKREVAAKGR
jgi:hypothetical protein